MKKPILIDTDVMIDFLRGNSQAENIIKRNSDNIILSSINVAELYAGVRGEKEQHILDSLISIFHVIPISSTLAKEGGLYKNSYAKSHGIGIADAIIAATVESKNALLKTLNTKHYPMFKNLRPAYKK
jgi:predicted nucleic acid-binding protein